MTKPQPAKPVKAHAYHDPDGEVILETVRSGEAECWRTFRLGHRILLRALGFTVRPVEIRGIEED